MLVLVSLMGLVAYLAGWQLWASHHFHAARRSLSRQDFAAAYAHLTLCLEVRPHNGETLIEAARAARRAGLYDEAYRHLQACKDLKWRPDATDLEFILLEMQRGNVRANEAIALDWVRRGHADAALILEALAQGYLKSYDLSRALHSLTLLLDKEPNHVKARIWRGDIFLLMKRMDRARDDYRQAVEVDPENEDALRGLANFLIGRHHADKALPHFEKLYGWHPDDPAIVVGLAKCKHELGQLEEAVHLLDAFLQSNPWEPKTLAEGGRIAMEQGNFKQAESWLRRAVDLAPFEKDIVFSFASLLEHQGKKEEAKTWRVRLKQVEADLERIKDLWERIGATPRDPLLRLEAGKLLLQNGQDQDGLRWIESALRENPQHQPTRDFLAQYYEKRGDERLADQFRRRQDGADGATPLLAPPSR
jgi:Tfp pilus assembly protein PilF